MDCQPRMRLTIAGLIVALGMLTAPLAGAAQQPAKVARIGYLGTGSVSAPTHPVEVFRRALQELGYVEGQNLLVEYRFLEGHGPFSNLAAQLVRLKVDVIVAESPPASLAAKHATSTIRAGTSPGLAHLAPELSGKRLQLLKEAAPRVSRIAALWNPANPAATRALSETEAAARCSIVIGNGLSISRQRTACRRSIT